MTYLEQLSELPSPYAELALSRTDASILASQPTLPGLAECLSSAFLWCATPEGQDFWFEVHWAVKKGLLLPPIPKTVSALSEQRERG